MSFRTLNGWCIWVLLSSAAVAQAQPTAPPSAPPTPAAQPDATPPAAPPKQPQWLTDYTPPERTPSGDEEADGLVTLLSGSFGTDAKSATESNPGLVWNAAPVRIDGLRNAVYFEIARADDLPNPFRQGIISIYRRQADLRMRVLDFGGAPLKDALIGLWAAPEVFPSFSVEKLSPNLDISLSRAPDGSGYSGSTPHPFPTVKGGAVEATSTIKISADGFTIDDRGYDAMGKEIWKPDSPGGLVFQHIAPTVTVRRRDDHLITIDLVPGETSGVLLQPGGELALHFSQYLLDGTRLDSSRLGNRAPIQTRVPVGSMKGLDEGLMGMAKGTRRRIIIPPALGFGEQARGVVPPNSTVIFDIESLWQQAPPAAPEPGAPAGPVPPNTNPPNQPPAPPRGGGH